MSVYHDKRGRKPPIPPGGGTVDEEARQDIATLQKDKADKAEVAAVWNQMADAVREGVNRV